MTPDKALVEVFGREAGVALPVKPLDLLGLVVRNRPAGAPPQAPVQKPVFAFLLKPPGPPPKCPLACRLALNCENEGVSVGLGT